MLASENDVKIINETIDIAIRNGSFRNKTAVIFGCNSYSRAIITRLESNGIRVDGFIDNDRAKAGRFCLGLMTKTPGEYKCSDNTEPLFIVASKYFQEMRGQLQSLGYQDRNILFVQVEEAATWEEPSKENFDRNINALHKGLKCYERIQRETNCSVMFLCPYPGTGDIYMAGCFFNAYLEKHNISDYVFVAVGNNCRKIAQLFEINNIRIATKEEMDSLLRAYEICSDQLNIKPLLYWGWRTKRFLHGGLNGLSQVSFANLFKYDVFGFDESDEIHPPQTRQSDYAESLFCKLGLKKGRTVILAPYAGSFKSDISLSTWEEIDMGLRKKGYSVCTNSAGANEPAVGKSTPIIFPYKEAVNVLNYAGGFIGLRSGLCDVVSSSEAKQVVIYENSFSAVDMSFFGIRKMGLNDSVIEVDFQGQSDLSENILKEFPKL